MNTAIDKQALRDRVLSEAEAAFLEQGFFGFSVRQVAIAVGVPPGTVASLFGSKRDLLRLVEARLQAKQANAMPPPVECHRDS